MVSTYTHVIAGVNTSAPLADQNSPGVHTLPGKPFYTEPLALAIPAVAAGAASLFMRHLLSPLFSCGGYYLVYHQPGEKLAVSCLAAVANLGLILKNNNLLTLAVSLHRSQHLDIGNSRFADRYLVTIGDKQYPVQFDSAALSHIQMLYIYGLTVSYFILLATGFNNSVNFKPPSKLLYQLL